LGEIKIFSSYFKKIKKTKQKIDEKKRKSEVERFFRVLGT